MNKQSLIITIRIGFATALFSAAIVCLVQAEPNRTQQGDIDICLGNYNDCIRSCKTIFGSADDADRRNKCLSPCLANMITCINGTVAAVVPGQSPPPRATAPPGATAPTSTTNPISAPIP